MLGAILTVAALGTLWFAVKKWGDRRAEVDQQLSEAAARREEERLAEQEKAAEAEAEDTKEQ